MGLVKKDQKDQNEAEKDAPEDPPIVKQLKELDDKYLEVEKEMQREIQKLANKYTKLQQPLLEERKQVLVATDGDGAKTGTPALSGFWLKAMQNHPAFEDIIQEWDEPVMEFLEDMEKANLDEEDGDKGFSLTLHFAPNPYFSNTVIKKEYHTESSNPYCGEVDVKLIKCDTIEWKEGKDVTVEKVAKKVKGGGAKKAKQKGKETIQPRPSFFRDFFRNLDSENTKLSEEDKELMQGSMMGDPEDDDDDGDMLEYLMDGNYEMGCALRDTVIPFAVRWYTGDAAPDMEDDDEDDESEGDLDDDDDEDDDDSEDEPPRGAKGRGKGAKKKAGPKTSPEMKPSEAPKEECKQQ